MKVTINFVIKDGQVMADVVGAKGKVCAHLLAELEAYLGEAGTTEFKPEYELDEEVLEILRDQEAKL